MKRERTLLVHCACPTELQFDFKKCDMECSLVNLKKKKRENTDGALHHTPCSIDLVALLFLVSEVEVPQSLQRIA